jgi:hypothetical protein
MTTDITFCSNPDGQSDVCAGCKRNLDLYPDVYRCDVLSWSDFSTTFDGENCEMYWEHKE